MRLEFCEEVDFDVDDIIEKMDHDEQLVMYNSMAHELGKAEYKEDFDVAKYFSQKSLYEQKVILCNALNVVNYLDDEALRKALEKIITAR